MAEETETQPIVIDLRPYGERLELDTVDAVEKWLTEERSNWAPLFSKLGHGGSETASNAAQSLVNQRLGQVEQSIQQYRQAPSRKKIPPMPEQALRDFAAQIASYFPADRRQEIYISSKSPALARALEIAQKEPERAAFFLVVLMKAAWNNRNLHANSIFQSDPTSLFAGLVDAELFKRGIEGATDAERTALTQLRQQWVDELQNHKQRYETEIKAARADIDARQKAEHQHDQAFATMLKHGGVAFADGVKAAKQQFDTLNETYDKHLTLKSAVKFWRRRAWLASGLTVVLLAAVSGAGVALVLYMDHVIQGLVAASASSGATAQAAASTGTPAPSAGGAWIRYSIAPVTFLMGAWFIRMLSRLLYWNYQSATTAFEKATMMESFLALIRDAQGLPSGAINTLLSAIYHPPTNAAIAEPMLEPGMSDTAKEAIGKIK